MKSDKRTIRVMANNYRLNPDELVLKAWYKDQKYFEYLKNENSVIKIKDYQVIKSLAKSISMVRTNNQETKRPVPAIDNIYAPVVNFSFSLGTPCEDFKYLDKENVVNIHEELVADFSQSDNPIFPSGIKDESLLESAIFRPRTSIGDEFKYKTIEAAGAALWHSISQNHCFHNGNKRTSIVSLLTFLDRHNISLTCDEDDLFKEAMMIAQHQLKEPYNADIETYEIMTWLHYNNRKDTKIGEKAITLRRLCKVLRCFGCDIQGFSASIIVERKSFLGIRYKKLLKTRLPEMSDGDDVAKSVTKKIRSDLELDYEYGIDFDAFYNGAEFSASEFIFRYKKTLRRLSKL
jgi:death-on-curing protein